MTVLNVAFVGSQETAKSLAKLNDTRDIESYVYKIVEDGVTKVLSILRPLRHPERLRPLLSVLNVARAGVIEISKIDAAIGEVLVAFGCSGIKYGHIIIKPEEGGWVDPAQVKVIVQQAGLGDWVVHETPPSEHELRDSLFTTLNSLNDRSEEPLVLPVDQHFNVKGVGLVAIGYVGAGRVDKHDRLLALPAAESGVARSLQVMDDDVETAFAGDRVGVAMRDLREAALERGSIIVKGATAADFAEVLQKHVKTELTLVRAPFQQQEISVGDVIHGAVDLQFTVGRIAAIKGDSVTITWDHPLFIRQNNMPRLLLTQLDAKMRILGFSEIVSQSE